MVLEGWIEELWGHSGGAVNRTGVRSVVKARGRAWLAPAGQPGPAICGRGEMGKGTSEVQAVLEGIRQLDARLTACEKDLIRLAQLVERAARPVVVSDAPLAIVPVIGKGKGKRGGQG